jgi:hypothetical protein
MRKIVLLAVVALIVIGIGTWLGIRARGPTGAVASSTDNSPVMMTGAKGLPASHYDDYDLVVH